MGSPYSAFKLVFVLSFLISCQENEKLTISDHIIAGDSTSAGIIHENINVIFDCSPGTNGCYYTQQISSIELIVKSQRGTSFSEKGVYLKNLENIIFVSVDPNVLELVRIHSFGDLINESLTYSNQSDLVLNDYRYQSYGDLTSIGGLWLGQEDKYLGFMSMDKKKLFGWIRLTINKSGKVHIKDWAYTQ